MPGRASLALYEALRRNRQVLAGAIWAVMMIKPHLATLLFWPLVLSKRYVAVTVAIGIVCAATLVPAWVYGQSPIELLLEIPRIGAPYIATDGGYCTGPMYLAQTLLGPALAPYALAGVSFALCALLCVCTRRYSDWWMKMPRNTATALTVLWVCQLVFTVLRYTLSRAVRPLGWTDALLRVILLFVIVYDYVRGKREQPRPSAPAHDECAVRWQGKT